jgi:hypothetical protein
MRAPWRRRPGAGRHAGGPSPAPPPRPPGPPPVTELEIRRALRVVTGFPEINAVDPHPVLSWTQVVLLARAQNDAARVLARALRQAQADVAADDELWDRQW